MNIYTVKVVLKSENEQPTVLYTFDDVIASDEQTATLKVVASKKFSKLEVDIEDIDLRVRKF